MSDFVIYVSDFSDDVLRFEKWNSISLTYDILTLNFVFY